MRTTVLLAMRSLVFLVIFLGLYSIRSTYAACSLTKEYDVHIVNALPNNLTIHCASKDDDLGFHNLTDGADFTWRFCANLFGKTLFFCHFWWQSKEQMFDVFNKEMAKKCSCGYQMGNLCYWNIRADGFYFSKDYKPFPEGYVKEYEWR